MTLAVVSPAPEQEPVVIARAVDETVEVARSDVDTRRSNHIPLVAVGCFGGRCCNHGRDASDCYSADGRACKLAIDFHQAPSRT